MSAIFSTCLKYRYRLERQIGMFGQVGAFLMVNPSTANASEDDQTIRKVKGFATRLGWSKAIVGNVFAYRATDITSLAGVVEPVGPENEAHLRRIIEDSETVVCAWGALEKLPLKLRDDWRTIVQLAQTNGKPLFCLGKVKSGHPKHPLMVSYSASVVDWAAPID